jgi:hypothetical protein
MARPERPASVAWRDPDRDAPAADPAATLAERTATPNGIAEAIRTSIGKKIRLDAGHERSRGGICCLRLMLAEAECKARLVFAPNA